VAKEHDLSAWTALLPVAMVGTERQAPVAPAMDGPVGELLLAAGADGDNAASQLLHMAAVLATCAQAGAQGTPWPGAVPAAAPAEIKKPLDDASAVLLLAWALREGPQRLQQLAFQALAAGDRRLPHELLPPALESGRRSIALRAALQPALGERGVWLAGQNAAWNFAAGVAAQADETVRWAEGNLAQRCELLRRERLRDPAAARERLRQVLGDLPARERAELASELATALSMEDEALLESLRRDRAREVRQAALGLLLRLPDSTHVQRAQQRLQPLLRHERVLLRMRWRIDAPSAVVDDWKNDGIEPTRPANDALGDRAWWLYQLARQAPLAWWCSHTGMSPAELINWAMDGDWGDALLRAWREVLAMQPDVPWCEAFLDNWPKKHPADDFVSILALLPLARRERYWEKHLKAANLHAQLPQIVQACPPGECLSAGFSLAIADIIARNPGLLDSDYMLRNLMPDLCCVLQPAALQRIGAITRKPDETQSLVDLWHTVGQIIATRRALNC
jgi:hypothetical protein